MLMSEMTRMNRSWKLAAIAAPALALTALSGCVSIGGGGEQPDQLIDLTPRAVAPAGASESGQVDEAVFVFEPEVQNRLDNKRVPVQIDDSSVAYLQGATYVDRPARLFQHLLAETLRAKGGMLVVEGVDPGLPNRTRLYGQLVDMGYNARSSSVIVTYDAVQIAPDGTVRSQRFSHTVDGLTPDVISVAPALNEAANAVALDVANWFDPGK